MESLKSNARIQDAFKQRLKKQEIILQAMKRKRHTFSNKVQSFSLVLVSTDFAFRTFQKREIMGIIKGQIFKRLWYLRGI